MSLHARRKGANAALIYFPCCPWSLIEDLPKASFCFIAISFFIILRCCLHSMNFFFNAQNRKYTKALLHCTVHKIFFPTSLYLPKSDSEQESYVHFTSAMKSVLKFQNAQRSTPCTGPQTRWFLMRWNGNLMELLDISFSSFLHLWTSSQIDEDSNIHCGIWRGWWFI
jgi:hypothetical protein